MQGTRARGPGQIGRLGLLMVVCLLPSACAGAVSSTGAEDKLRRDVPIAVCRKALAPADLNESGAPHQPAYWKVIVPSFRGFGSALDPDALTCVGDPAQPLVAGAPADAHASRVPVVTDATGTIVPAVDDLVVVWLRTVTVSDRASRGPLAIVRARPAEIDVYSLGTYEGSTRHSRFEVMRIATTTVVVARDEACADSKVDAECESVATIFAAAGGNLPPAARVTVERAAFGTMKEIGKVKYRLTTDPFTLDAASLHVKEHLTVRDANDEEVRKAEGERIFAFAGAELTTKQPSIWSAAVPPAPSAPPKP